MVELKIPVEPLIVGEGIEVVAGGKDFVTVEGTG